MLRVQWEHPENYVRIGFYHFQPHGIDKQRTLEKIIFFFRKAVGEEDGKWHGRW